MNFYRSEEGMKKLLTAILIVLLLGGCGKSEQIERSEIAMHTIITLKANGSSARKAIDQSFRRIAELEKIFDVDTKKMNAAAGNGEFIQVNRETFEMLELAREFHDRTDGAFDVTLGAAIELWNFGDENPRVPRGAEIEEVKSRVGFEHLKLRAEDCSVNTDRAGVSINFGGIAKGYAADEVRKIFVENGIDDGLIDFGTSTLFAVGKKNVGLKKPSKPDELIDVIELENAALSTSGDYMKFFIVDGRRYHHIIDPRTCAPVENGISAVSVVVDGDLENCCAIADILSTAIFVTGEDRAAKIFPNVNYMIFRR